MLPIIKILPSIDLPYPKIEKTVPHFLTVREYNLILHHCSKNAATFIGLRNLIIIMMLGILGLRTNSIISMNVQDMDLAAGLAWLKEKGNIKRNIVLPKVLCTVLKPYLKELLQVKTFAVDTVENYVSCLALSCIVSMQKTVWRSFRFTARVLIFLNGWPCCEKKGSAIAGCSTIIAH